MSNDDPEREGLDRALPVDPGSRVGDQGAVLSHRRRGRRLFERIRYRRADESVFSYAFDLLELDGQELRREPIETGKATLASLLRGCGVGLRLVEHLEHGGDVVYRHACKLGCEYTGGRIYESLWDSLWTPFGPALDRQYESLWDSG